MSLSPSFPVRAILACGLALLPSVSLAAGGFKCAVVGPGADPSHTLFVLHAGDVLSPNSAVVILEEDGTLVSKPAQVSAFGSVRFGKSFDYSIADAPAGTSLSVRLPSTGACGRGACDADPATKASLTKDGATVAYTCSSL